MGYFNDDEKETQPAASGALPVDGERRRIIREYLQKKYDEAAASDGVNGAQRKADMYDVAGTVGKQVENYANASAPAMTYLQGWQRISEPKMTTPHKLENDWDGIRDAGREEVKRAEAARQGKLNAFMTGMELDDRSRAMVGAERQDALQAQEDDVASEVSRSYQALAKKMMPSRDFSTVSATQLKQVVPALEKAYQIDQQRLIRQESAAQRAQDRLDAKESKRQEKAKLSDKQVEEINDYDNSINQMRGVLQNLGDRSNWVGLVDGAVPDFAVGGKQAAFRSSLGRMKDAYRKLITGAGASNTELKKLESRLPSEFDTYEQFQAKAADFLREVEKSKKTHLQNLQRNGKNVDEFTNPIDAGRFSSQKSKPSWAK